MLGVAIVLLLVGIPLSMFGVFAVAVHDTHGEVKELLASILVVLLCLSPLIVGTLALGAGVRWSRRGARLRELRSLVFGRESVSCAELAARTRRPETEILALLSVAEEHDAAWRTS
jgi:ABC-type molybdate transport system permease subunit